MAGNEDHEVETFKTYTGARKFRKYVGRFLTGEKIWGGPYPLAVFVVGAAVLGLLVWTYELWKSDFIISDAIKGGSIIAVVMLVAWKIPATNRPLWSMALSVSRATFAPTAGTVGGVTKTLRKPHRPFGKQPTRPARVASVSVTPPVAPSPAPRPPAPTKQIRPASAVEVLLAQSRTR